MKWLLRLNKGFWYSLLLFVFITVVLAFSQTGLRFNLWLVDYLVPELSIGKAEGNLLGGFRVHDLSYHTEQLQLDIDSAEFDNHLPCLFGLSLCINTLQVDGLTVIISGDDTPADNTAEQVTLPPIWNPFPVSVRQLQLNQVQLKLGSNRVEWQQLSSGFDFWGNRLVLSTTTLQQLAVYTEAESASDEPAPSFEWQALQLPDILFPLQLDMAHFELFGFQLNEQTMLDQLHAGVLIERRQLRLTDVVLLHDTVELNAEFTVQPQGKYPLDAAIRLTHAKVPDEPVQLVMALSGDLAQLQVDASIDGMLQAQAQLQANLMQDHLPLELTLSSPYVQWPLSGPSEFSASSNRVKATGTLQSLELDVSSKVQGTELPDTNLQLQATASTEYLQLHQLALTTLGGTITSQGQLNFSDQISWSSSWQLEHIDPGMQWSDYPGLLMGQVDIAGELTPEQGWQLDISALQLSGTLRQIPLNLSGQLQMQDQTGTGDIELTAKPLRVHHGQNQLELTGTLQQDWAMQMRIDIDDLSDSVPDAQGQAQGLVELAGPRLTPDISFSFNASQLQWQELLQLESADFSGQFNSMEPMQTDVTITLTEMRYLDHQLDSAMLTLQGNEGDHRLELSIDGSPVSLTSALQGRFERETGLWQGQWLRGEITSELGVWRLAQAMDLQLTPTESSVVIGAHCWQRDDSSLCLTETADISPEQLAVAISLEQFDLTWLAPWLPDFTELRGHIAADARLAWQPTEGPSASLHIHSAKGIAGQQFDQLIRLPWSDLNIRAELNQQQLNAEWQLFVSEKGEVAGQLQLDDITKLDQDLNASLSIKQFSFEFLEPMLDDYSELRAILNSQIQVQGSLLQPNVSGELSIRDITVRGQLAPVDIEQGELQIGFNQDSALLSGQITTPQGQLNLAGDANWAELSAWQALLTVKGDPLSVQLPMGRLQVQPDLTLQSSPEKTLLTGTVDIPFARLTIDSLPESAVSLSSDEVMVDAEFQPLVEATDTVPFNFETNIRVRFGDQVRFTAFGLRTHVAGSLQVRQNNNQPRLYGELNLVDGTFRSYGQDLLIRRGQLLFNGPADQPFLNLEAIRNPDNIEDDVIAGIRVSGPADEPNIQIFSEPGMAQANATSYLLLGRNLDGESGSSANPVTTSLIGLGLASSSKLVGNIGEAFGVQDLMLDTAGSGDQSQVTVSGYLTRDLQVKYGVGLFEQFGEFTLRYRLMRNLYLESVTGIEQSIDLLYRFEFD
ncbi:translocation/assembly module TamB domain-containing protein [Alkalimonas collagenimarina]|uniref:Translocation/assembly module TamB domain-containing protein n=1 Tax=Alkalimonas collagenimarina TaxID=400390 RepID=A0ABT9GWN1_9GAMM|nr:translocation/assembly module TamB domain-containing protein [Alkalimonas collagenimarina]MDP4535373.1 translocation/assembly module TamB domain-containing protein [Alkalimonas collagenimarina]